MASRWLAFATAGGGDESPPRDSIGAGGDEFPHREALDHRRPTGGGADATSAIDPWAPPTPRVPFGWASPVERRDMRRYAGTFARFPLHRCADELAIFAKTVVALMDPATASLHDHLLGTGFVPCSRMPP